MTAAAGYTRLDLAGLTGSVGSVGDAHDNALAETIIGVYKTEAIDDDSRSVPEN